MEDNNSSHTTYSFFEKMDRAMEKGIIALQGSQFYSQGADAFDNLDDDIRKIMRQLTGLVIVFLPLVLCLTLLTINSCKESDIEMKQEILKLSQNYSSKQKNIAQSSRHLISTKEILNQQQLMNIIEETVSAAGISAHSFTIKEFNQTNVTKSIAKTSAHITFEKMVLGHLMTIIQNLSNTSRIHTVDIQIKKDEKELLFGFLNTAHYAKSTADTTPKKGQ